MKNKILGVIDSGIGGLTLVNEILESSLNLTLIYICDSSHVPYGNKEDKFIQERINLMVKRLLDKKVDAILIACNTVTTNHIEVLRQTFNIAFIGIEPFINYININHESNRNCALALTQATFRSARFKDLQNRYDTDQSIDIFPMKNLASLIEKLKFKNFTEIKDQVDHELLPLKNKQYTHLILGCTHYSFLSKYIEQSLNLKAISPNQSILKQIQNILPESSVETKEMVNEFDYSDDCGENWKIIKMSSFNFYNFL